MDIRPEDVYFTFGSGRLTYDCVRCGSKCCRGYGYALVRDQELTYQLAVAPQVALFVDTTKDTGSRHLYVLNNPPGCFFLRDDGRCNIHTQAGFETKPETCRLFPFNDFVRLGKYLIVQPHIGLCPLKVTSPGEWTEGSDHAILLRDICAKGIYSPVPVSRPVVAAQDRLIETERQIVGASEAHLNSGDVIGFSRAQIEISAGAAADLSDNERMSIDDFIACTRKLLDTPDRSALGHDGDLVRTMIAVTPCLRARLLFQMSEEPSYEPEGVSSTDVSRSVLMIYLIAEAMRSTGAHVTYQSLCRFALNFLPLIHLMAKLDRIVVWKRSSALDFKKSLGSTAADTAYIKLVRDLLPSIQRKQGLPLGELLERYAPVERFERVQFIKQVAVRFAGRLAPISAEPETRALKVRTRIRNAGQRWALAKLSDADLELRSRHLTTTN